MSSNREKFILASESPRRKLLLETAGYSFNVIPSSVDETEIATGSGDSIEHAKILALAKAADVAQKYPDRFVFGADTIVDCDGQIIGKPKDAEDAERITRMLFSKSHKVITAVALLNIERAVEIVEAVVTIVYPRKLTEEQIAGHIKGGNWHGKAGAYGIQETGDEFVERIEGSFTNVIGLPMELMEKLIKEVVLTD
jgi:septum formation protein